MSIPHNSTHTNQLITYLRQGITPVEISRALGITPGAVTQLMASPEVATELAKLQAEQQARSSAIDARYDSMEEKLLGQLEKTIPLLLRPHEISKVLATINAAKRRGVAHQIQSGPAQILQLNIPIALQTKFVVNSSNQVVEAGEQTLVTMPSGNIPNMAQQLVKSLPSPAQGVDHDTHNIANHKQAEASKIESSGESTINIEQEDEFGFTYSR